MKMNLILLIISLPLVLSSPYRDLQIQSNEECWSEENRDLLKKNYEILLKFSPKVTFEADNCTVQITNPWLADIQNGFGLFLPRQMDCSSMLTIECLTVDNSESNIATPLPVLFTCHTSENKIEMPCSSISLVLRRNVKMPEGRKPTYVQVVALAKKPCIDDDLFFQCPIDYPNSCIDKRLKCNGRSECPSGDDERDCHTPPASGMPLIAFFLIAITVLILVCALTSVFICCCCLTAFNGIVRRFRSRNPNRSNAKNNVPTNGEDPLIMKGLTTPITDVEVSSQRQTEPTTLIIDSTKPIYPHLE